MVAEARNLYVLFFGCLEDGKVVIDLVRFIVDENFYLFGGEGCVGSEVFLEERRP